MADNIERTREWLDAAQAGHAAALDRMEAEFDWYLDSRVLRLRADILLSEKAAPRIVRHLVNCYTKSIHEIVAMQGRDTAQIVVESTKIPGGLVVVNALDHLSKYTAAVTRLLTTKSSTAFNKLISAVGYYGYCLACMGPMAFLPLERGVNTQFHNPLIFFKDPNNQLLNYLETREITPCFNDMIGMHPDCLTMFRCRGCQAVMPLDFDLEDYLSRAEERKCPKCSSNTLTNVKRPRIIGFARRLARQTVIADIVI